MSLTSHDIHPIAKRHALSIVTMRHNATIMRVCTYMLEDIPGRLHWIRELEVGFDDMTDTSAYPSQDHLHLGNTTARLLVSLFENAIHLRSLWFLYSFDTLLLKQPRIGPALSALRHLRILSLPSPLLSLNLNPGDKSKTESLAIQRQMLREMRSRLIELSLSIPSSDLSSIQHMQTIRRLTLSQLHSDNEEHPSHAERSQLSLSWPAVSSLTLGRCRLSMSDVARAFPNVRELRADYLSGSSSTSSVCWPHLDYVEGPKALFGTWSFDCRMHHLSVTSILHLATADDVTVLHAIRQMSPRVLEFTVPPMQDDTFWASLAEIAPQVRSLEIMTWVFWSETDLVFKMAQQLILYAGDPNLAVAHGKLCTRIKNEL
ncbi:predicted protein [Postia placenta Mad-698-R]|uniref:F-box domain-containing protein n=1 Tax=Postia placenta MAD-698-R-SB12 TaxID=670580 RepID=A0A1X6MXH7_9APHY|nr:hypothetical protein POSPLADRAFT_1146456 [Postia placenta MAD-698-R-SB12]EED85039.1 predicted protein [Postia placenta Mad-698-R]OSX60936.1 hypothetical protein POSPLADRAFT_1146456 [Postia placenta MAD-698-R-SB12]